MKYDYITLRERPEIKETAAEWFSSKWGVPKEAYLECMEDYLSGKTEYGWYLCLDGTRERIWLPMSAPFIPRRVTAVRVSRERCWIW